MSNYQDKKESEKGSTVSLCYLKFGIEFYLIIFFSEHSLSMALLLAISSIIASYYIIDKFTSFYKQIYFTVLFFIFVSAVLLMLFQSINAIFISLIISAISLFIHTFKSNINIILKKVAY